VVKLTQEVVEQNQLLQQAMQQQQAQLSQHQVKCMRFCVWFCGARSWCKCSMPCNRIDSLTTSCEEGVPGASQKTA
jgi:hypothetical protein